MDAWSSPWGDDSATPDASASKPTDQGNDTAPSLGISATHFASLNTFDASDPWAIEPAPPAPKPDLSPDPSAAASAEEATPASGEISRLQTTSYAAAPWGYASASPIHESKDLPTITTSEAGLPPASDAETRSTPHRQQSLPSHDPWATDASTAWGGEEHGTSSAFPTSEAEPYSTGWGANESSYSPPKDLEQRFSSARIGSPTLDSNPYATHEAPEDVDASRGQDDTATNLDAWAAEASTREEKARRLDREEIDELKVGARRLISSVKTERDTQDSFADPSSSEGGWADLFGSQGTQRDKLHHLQTPPSALTSSNGALRSHLLQSSPMTLNQLRSSIVKTENHGVRLTSTDQSSSFQRGSRPTTKTDWLPDQLTAEADGLSFGAASATANSSTPGTSSGPGWTQTSSNEARSTSGSGFLASFFKGRQPSANSASEPTAAPRNAQTQQGRNSSSSFEASPAVSASAHFEPYQDTAGKRYLDDPTGPDLLSLDTAASAPAAPPKDAQPAQPAQSSGLLSRWRNSGVFKGSSKKQGPSWASGNLRADDLDWLDEQGSSDSKQGPYHYDEDEEDADDAFASFNDSARRSSSSRARTDAAQTSRALDPFDDLLGAAAPPSLNTNANVTAPSSARSSLSANRISGEGGMMTIKTNLARANSLRKNTASPLQPPPQTQNKRMPLAPPPMRANAAPPITVQQPTPASVDPFADFLTDAPSQPPSNANTVKAQQPPSTATKAPPSNGKGGLTADELLFFDSL